MPAAVVDTHVALWYIVGSNRLSGPATDALDETLSLGDAIHLASISLVELVYLVEKARVPPAAMEQLLSTVADPEGAFELVALDLAVCTALRSISREEVPDMPDRIIAATALCLRLPLITADRRIRASGVVTIW